MGKRGNGQGSALRRGKTWTAIWTEELYEVDGKLVQRRKWKGGFRTKTEALQYAAAPALGKKDPDKAPTLRDYHTLWKKADYLDLSKSKQTAFDIAWGRLEDLAGVPMNELTIEQLQDAVDRNARTHYPAKDMRALLSHLFVLAQAEGKVVSNLAKFIRIPPLEEKEMQPFTEEEIRKLWDAYAGGERTIGYILLMIYTGMMPGELFQCKSDMIDWKAREIIGCGLKTKKRKVTPIVYPEIIEPVLMNLVTSSISKKGYIMDSNRDRFYSNYHEALKNAGVRDLPPYSCRHTTATALAMGNTAPSTIQTVMRHTKFTTTQRYIHPDMASAKAAVNTIGQGNRAKNSDAEQVPS